ncbi:MAG: hypothetical protein ACFFCW_24180 [Candidatus Hodarchaeota archaeon]
MANEDIDVSDVTGMTCRIKTSTNFVIWLHLYDTSGHQFMLGLVQGGTEGSHSRFGDFGYYFLGPGLTDGNWHIIDINIDEVFQSILSVGINSIRAVYLGGHIWVDDLCFY